MKIHKFMLTKVVEKSRFIEIETPDDYDHQELNSLLWNQVGLNERQASLPHMRAFSGDAKVIDDTQDTSLPDWKLDESEYEVVKKEEK